MASASETLMNPIGSFEILGIPVLVGPLEALGILVRYKEHLGILIRPLTTKFNMAAPRTRPHEH